MKAKNFEQSLCCLLMFVLLATQAQGLPGYHIDSESSVQKAVKQYANDSFKFRAVVYQSILDKHSRQLTLAAHRYLLLKPENLERKCSFAIAYWQTQLPGVNESITLADAKQLQSLYGEAVQDTKEAVQKMPNSASAHLNYGQYLQYFVPGMEKVPLMIHEYQKVVILKPHLAEAHYLLGMAYLGSGDSSIKTSHKTIVEFKEAVALDPHLTDSYSRLVTVYWLLNDWKEVRFYLQEYVRLNPKAAVRPDVVAALKTANEKIATGL